MGRSLACGVDILWECRRSRNRGPMDTGTGNGGTHLAMIGSPKAAELEPGLPEPLLRQQVRLGLPPAMAERQGMRGWLLVQAVVARQSAAAVGCLAVVVWRLPGLRRVQRVRRGLPPAVG